MGLGYFLKLAETKAGHFRITKMSGRGGGERSEKRRNAKAIAAIQKMLRITGYDPKASVVGVWEQSMAAKWLGKWGA